MSENVQPSSSGAPEGEANLAVRPWLRRGCVLLPMVCVVSMAGFARKRHAPPPSVQPEVETVPAVPRASSEPSRPSDPAAVGKEAPPTPAVPAQPAVSARRQPVPLTLPEPSPQTRQLVSTLLWPGQVGRPFTSEQAVEWKQNLQ